MVAGALVILALVTMPEVATLPPKSPLPSGHPFHTVWSLFVDLQNQINALKIQIAAIPAGPVGPAGPQGARQAAGIP